MCCFSREVEHVWDTKIFARMLRKNTQGLIYQMQVRVRTDVSMILPIPVRMGVKEDAVEFVNFEGYVKFFDDLEKGFDPPARSKKNGGGGFGGGALGRPTLRVVEVGSFAASFVPTIADFARLDEQFRLPLNTWDKIPAYKNYGFVVFKLRSGEQKVHPMAFKFPTLDNPKLFFPTLHIHDGEIHEKAEFGHKLYMQPDSEEQMLPEGWDESMQPATMFLNLEKCKGMLSRGLHCYRRSLIGQMKNEDIFVA